MRPKQYPSIYDTWDIYARQLGLKSADLNVLESYCSCGVSVLSGLQDSTPEQVVYKVLKERASMDYKKIKEAFVIFSDTIYGNGNNVYTYIQNNKIGNIVEFGPRQNPNTGNMIKFWVWEPPHENLDPKTRFMPVYGKKIKLDFNGWHMGYEDDPRFKDAKAKEA